MDKLTAIKIKNPDGSYSTPIAISALAQNVLYGDGVYSVKDILDSLDARIDNVTAVGTDGQLTAIRVGADNETYATARAAIVANDIKNRELVLVKDTQPTETWNKLWLDTSDTDEQRIISTDDMANIIAAYYDEESDYAIGDYVIYEDTTTGVGKLYKCKTTISGGEAWTAAHWNEISVTEDYNNLIQDVNDYLKSALVDKLDNFTNVQFSINDIRITTQGSHSNVTGFKSTALYPCKPGTTVSFYGRDFYYSGDYASCVIAFYNSNESFISGILSVNESNNISTVGHASTVAPANTAYVAFSTNGYTDGFYAHVCDVVVEPAPDLSIINNLLDNLYTITELNNKTSPNGWKLVPDSGLCIADENYKLIKYPVTAGDIIKVVSDSHYQFQNSSSVPAQGSNNRVGATGGVYNGKITVPTGATYLVMDTMVSGGTAIAYSISHSTDNKLDKIHTTLEISKKDELFMQGSLQSSSHAVATEELPAIAYIAYIPVTGGERVQFNVQTIEGYTYKYRLAFYGSDKSYISQISADANTVQTIPNNVYYFSFTVFAYVASSGSYATGWNLYNHLTAAIPVTVTFIDRWKTQYVDRDDVTRMIEGNSDPDDIVLLNRDIEERLLQAKRRINGSNNAYLGNPQPVVLLHFSDIHGDKTELQRMVEIHERYKSMIDDIICTGDLVEYRYANGIDFWSNTDGAEDILIAIGNHDVLTDPSGYDWTQRASQSDQYTRYIAPFVDNWGVTYTSGKTYYYKDYIEKSLRLIVLNCMLTGDDDSAQLSWFENVLDDAKTESLSVVVANHYMIANPEKVSCNFSILDKNVGTDVLPLAYLAAIDDFKGGGGKFVCHIAGHTHWDIIVRSTTYPDQICIVIDALSRAQANMYSDTQRTDGTKSQDLANLVAFDTASGVVKIMRIGANMDHYLREKNCITINYTTGEIITQN